MADVTIERLEITVELDGAGAEEYFARLFTRHVAAWWAEEQQRAGDRLFAERERRLPDGGSEQEIGR